MSVLELPPSTAGPQLYAGRGDAAQLGAPAPGFPSSQGGDAWKVPDLGLLSGTTGSWFCPSVVSLFPSKTVLGIVKVSISEGGWLEESCLVRLPILFRRRPRTTFQGLGLGQFSTISTRLAFAGWQDSSS